MENTSMVESKKDIYAQSQLTKKDLMTTFVFSNFQQASFNFERIHALAFCVDMIPTIRRVYKTKEEQAEALKRHLTFFNTTPAVCGPVIGVTMAMEEARASGADIDDGTINSLKVGLMGPILFFVAFNAIRLSMKWFGLTYGFSKGMDIVKDLSGNLLQKLTEGATILGLFIMGVLVTKWTTVNIPLVVSKTPGADGKTVITTVQNVLDDLVPGLPALGLTLLMMYLLKKKVSPIVLIFVLFAVGIIGYWLGILA